MGNNINLTLLITGFASFIMLSASANQALAKCVRIDPLFGFKTYVDDKYCEKKETKKKTVRKKSVKLANVKNKTTPKKKAASKKPLRVTTADKEILEMQTLLAGLGYDPGPLDGYKGPKTKEASTAFKKAVGLRIGTDTEETIEVLKRIAGK